MQIQGTKAFLLAAGLLAAGALLHVAVLVAGPEWIAFVGAPPEIVASARAGTWLAPVGTLAITLLLIGLALCCLSAGGLIRRLPFARAVLVPFAAIFVLRGLIIVPALLQGRVNWRAASDLFILGSSGAILVIGLALVAGLTARWHSNRGPAV
jgi:hypothetical protein